MKKVWFRRKLYGWGWTPVTWEGWLVIFLWVLIFIFVTQKMKYELVKNIIFIFVSIGFLLYICYTKGEKPRWQWGKRVEDEKDKK